MERKSEVYLSIDDVLRERYIQIKRGLIEEVVDYIIAHPEYDTLEDYKRLLATTWWTYVWMN